jgi:hypothetical protein
MVNLSLKGSKPHCLEKESLHLPELMSPHLPRYLTLILLLEQTRNQVKLGPYRKLNLGFQTKPQCAHSRLIDF